MDWAWAANRLIEKVSTTLPIQLFQFLSILAQEIYLDPELNSGTG